MKLLERDGAGERLECGVPACQLVGTDALNNFRENGIACAQMKDGSFQRLAPDDNDN